jgi:hypothetical protein
VSDVHPLVGLYSLKMLRIWDTPVSDLRPLAGLRAMGLVCH